MNDTLLWYTTRGAGAVSLLLLTAVFVLGVLSVRRFEARGWPRFLTQGLHRNLALLSVIFLGIHVVTSVVDPFTHLGWASAVVPFSTYYRTLWLGLGAISSDLIAAVIATSLVRGLLGYRSWKLVHWLAYASWPVGLVHSFGTGTDSHSTWLLAIGVLCCLAVVLATAWRLLGASPDRLAATRASLQLAEERLPR